MKKIIKNQKGVMHIYGLILVSVIILNYVYFSNQRLQQIKQLVRFEKQIEKDNITSAVTHLLKDGLICSTFLGAFSPQGNGVLVGGQQGDPLSQEVSIDDQRAILSSRPVISLAGGQYPDEKIFLTINNTIGKSSLRISQLRLAPHPSGDVNKVLLHIIFSDSNSTLGFMSSINLIFSRGTLANENKIETCLFSES